ncbi:MAG: hypothetical protein NTU88_00860, partial [Armatimonadetes bacterium]|nr:hypothetical protein [Armatimonadota bacterium]
MRTLPLWVYAAETHRPPTFEGSAPAGRMMRVAGYAEPDNGIVRMETTRVFPAGTVTLPRLT